MITSLLDTDLYKFKMLYFLWRTNQHETQVSYKLTNRGSVNPWDFAQREIDLTIMSLKALKFTFEELQYLQTLFPDPKFINYLSTLDLGWTEILHSQGIEYSGPIGAIILYETPIMAIINQEFNKVILKGMGRFKDENTTHFRNKLRTKLFEIADINAHSSIDRKIKFTEFGSRRRASLEFQKMAIQNILEICPDALIGTSNVMLAKEFNITPCGTIAHEMFMLYAANAMREADTKGIYLDMQDSQIELVTLWRHIFPETYWLTDTYGTEWFLRNMDKSLWGYRQDSGEPEMFMERLSYHNLLGKGKKIMFSDGLDVHQMIKLRSKYPEEDISFGWGTNLTNDGLVEPLRIVIKLHRVRCISTVKLSDNINKAIGKDIETYKKAFRYCQTNSQDIKY